MGQPRAGPGVAGGDHGPAGRGYPSGGWARLRHRRAGTGCNLPAVAERLVSLAAAGSDPKNLAEPAHAASGRPQQQSGDRAQRRRASPNNREGGRRTPSWRPIRGVIRPRAETFFSDGACSARRPSWGWLFASPGRIPCGPRSGPLPLRRSPASCSRAGGRWATWPRRLPKMRMPSARRSWRRHGRPHSLSGLCSAQSHFFYWRPPTPRDVLPSTGYGVSSGSVASWLPESSWASCAEEGKTSDCWSSPSACSSGLY